MRGGCRSAGSDQMEPLAVPFDRLRNALSVATQRHIPPGWFQPDGICSKLTPPGRRGTLPAAKGEQRMAEGQSGVGEVRVKPDRLHAFTMAICRADGSSPEE